MELFRRFNQTKPKKVAEVKSQPKKKRKKKVVVESLEESTLSSGTN